MTAEHALVIMILVAIGLAMALWWNVNGQRRAAQGILQRDRLYAMLSQCNQAIVHAADADALLPEICRIACVEGRFPLAWMAWQSESGHCIRAVAQHGDTRYLDQIVADGIVAQATDDPVAESIRRGQHMVVNDLRRTRSDSPWRVRALQSGFGSMAAFPVRFHRKSVAALAVYAPDDDAFGIEELRLLDEVAGDVSFALDAFDREASRR